MTGAARSMQFTPRSWIALLLAAWAYHASSAASSRTPAVVTPASVEGAPLRALRTAWRLQAGTGGWHDEICDLVREGTRLSYACPSEIAAVDLRTGQRLWRQSLAPTLIS